MAINYERVNWDTTSYVNPHNMNQMDEGIEAACNAADENGTQISAINSNLGKLLGNLEYGQITGSNGITNYFNAMPDSTTRICKINQPCSDFISNTASGVAILYKDVDGWGTIFAISNSNAYISGFSGSATMKDWKRVSTS